MLAKTTREPELELFDAYAQLATRLPMDDHPDMSHFVPIEQLVRQGREIEVRAEPWGSWSATGSLYNNGKTRDPDAVSGMIVVNPHQHSPIFVPKDYMTLKLITLASEVSTGALEMGRSRQLLDEKRRPLFGEKRFLSCRDELYICAGQAFSIAAKDSIAVLSIHSHEERWYRDRTHKMLKSPVADPFNNTADYAEYMDWSAEHDSE